jgi:hypothetical protein
VIENLSKIKKTTNEINKIRSNYLLPGTRLTQVEDYCQVPVIIIKNKTNTSIHSSQNGDLYNGWDLIVPNGWAMSFWLTMVHSGAKAVGQRELNYLMFESGVLQFPNDFSDTEQGQEANKRDCLDLYKKYIRRPPSKRVNYFKLGFLTPFSCPWKSVMRLSMSDKLDVDLEENKEAGFYILRNKRILMTMSNLFFNKNKQAKLAKLNLNQTEINSLMNSYTAVRLTTIGKGTIDTFSWLYDKSNVKPNSTTRTVDSNNDTTFNNARFVINNIINHHRSQVLANLESSGKVTAGSNINKLLRGNFNKHDLLKSETSFFELNKELLDSKTHRMPIGFVSHGGYTLVNGGISANAYILTKYLLNLVDSKETLDYNQRTSITYKTPNSSQLRNAKIIHLYI